MRFESAEFKGIEGTDLPMFMYNSIFRDKCVHLISRLYEKDQSVIESHIHEQGAP